VGTVIDMADEQAAPKEAGIVGWARDHIAAAAGLTVAAVVVLVVLVVVLVSATSGGGSSPSVAPGSIVQNGPLTTGYRVTGRVKARAATSVTVTIAAVDFAAPDARNVVLFPGQVILFEEPAQGVVAIARNGHRINAPSDLHNGDKVTLVGEFTAVGAPPAPAHQGYAFFGVEASTH
jgi:hypothetical protein